VLRTLRDVVQDGGGEEDDDDDDDDDGDDDFLHPSSPVEERDLPYPLLRSPTTSPEHSLTE
jgi:hypothetical protein